MKYVSKKYEKQLQDLAETLVNPERFEQVAPEVGQLVLFAVKTGPPTSESIGEVAIGGNW